MKNKKIYGFVLLALIIMLLPLGMVSAKYKQTKEVGTVTLDIAPPILSPNWYTKVDTHVTISELIVDSFTPEANPDTYSQLGLKWEEGKPVGYNPDGSYNLKGQVRLFEKGNTAYILAIGNNKVIFPVDSSYLFAGWDGENSRGTIVTERITFNNIDTSNVTNMASMFNGCSSLTSLGLDVSGFDTSEVINMSHMFNACNALTVLDLSNFNTSKVTDMSYMFNTCEILTSLDISSFDTSNVTNMENMFGSCYALAALNLSNFTTPNLKDMSKMFMQCRNLQSLDLSNFSTSDNTNMSHLFDYCIKLKQVTLGGKFKFINYSEDKTVLLPGQNNVNIPGADEKWYISNSDQGYNSTQAAVYHNEQNTITTYYAVKSEAPSSTNTFSLLTENGTINGAIQGN